ncbi:MAG: SurA N-terminal domain-containing protein [Sneathiella sp.]|nr:SurA N-terminal domain-containing protein [Sneathiella sp.]
MLEAMRKGAGGWLAKGMLGLLVLSFGAWGIGGDMLGSSVGANIIEVGDKTVTIGEFQRQYQIRLNQLSQYVGRQLTTEQARQFGVAQSTIFQLQTSLLESERANQLNLSVDDNIVLTDIRTGPTFKNSAGQFDRFRFQDILRRNGYSEGEYVEVLRGEIQRRQLTASMTLPDDKTPSVLVNTLFAYSGEKRSAEYVEILDANIAGVPTPTDDQLTAYIKDNVASFTSPEYRKAVFLNLTPSSFTEGVTVTDEELNAEFEGRGSEFNEPEKRAILQMIFENEDAAKVAVTKISSGADFANVAKEELQLTPADIDLGEITRNDLLEELQEPVFSVATNGVTFPVKTVLGWHLVKVTGITAGTNKTLADVKDILQKDIALRKGAEIMFEKATALQDEFAGGATVEEAAAATSLKISTTDWVDISSKDENGNIVKDLPAASEFMPELFDKTKDTEIDLSETAAGLYYAVAVTDIRDAKLKDLDTVRAEATTGWQKEWRHTENKKIAEGLLEKLKGGSTLDQLASSTVSSVQTTSSLRRNEQNPILAGDANAKLYSLGKNDFSLGSNATGNGYILFKVATITPADKVAEKDTISRLNEQLAVSIQQDLLAQYQNYLEKEIGVSIKQNLIREYF